MLKIMLVDDEPSVLESLRIFADWDKMGFEVVAEASDGIAAFPIISKTRPDLVICDIRMPGLSGLELMEKVNALIKPAPKFIVLSGYSDFSYAQKAIQLGTLGYLTKPLDAEELKQELSQAATIIKKGTKASRENLELIRYTANQLYNDIMEGKQSDKLSRKAQLIFNIAEKARIRVIEFITGTGEKTGNTPNDMICNSLMKIVGVQDENCIFYNGGGSYILVLNDNMQRAGYLETLQDQLSIKPNCADLERVEHGAFWILISGVSEGKVLQSIRNCGRQLEQLHTYCLLRPEQSFVSYDAFDKKKLLCEGTGKEGLRTFPELPFDRLVNIIKGNDLHEISLVLDIFFKELDQKVYSSRLCSVFLYRLADVVKKIAYAYGINANEPILCFTKSVENKHPACKELAEEMCNFVCKKLSSNNTKSIAILEDEVVDYIKANYRENLSLQSIAESFALSAIIISKIVRKKTGLKFNDYVNYLRIEHAKMLIASANMKVAAVSEESGYSDCDYFAQKFKKFAGVSPSEYKKKYS